MKINAIPCVTGQWYAPWIDPKKVQEYDTSQWTLQSWMQDQVISGLAWLWHSFVGVSFWVACIGGTILLIFFVVSKDKKLIHWVGYLAIGYLIICAINKAVG